MILYHGSNVEVREPRIIVSNRALDFGAGFYTTTDLEQAKRWAHLQTTRRKSGVSTVTAYNFDYAAAKKELNILQFESAGSDWLNFIARNRKNIYRGEKFDLVIGAVANDNTMSVIGDYVIGNISEETALILLQPQRLSNQYAFLTLKGLNMLEVGEIVS